jgi:hypothetical protein
MCSVLSNLVGESIHLHTIPECQIKMIMDVHEAGHVVYVENWIRTNPFEDQENMEQPHIQLTHLLMYVKFFLNGQL